MVRFIQGVPFDNNYAHTRWFTTRTEQFNYFNSFPKIERSQNNFQKSTGRMAIDVSEHVETMMKYDYLMYKNDDYGNKWFYAFILNVEYLDARTTRVYFEIDPIQTYMFDVDIKQSYVVREHETRTNNIYPEGLQVGSEYDIVTEWDVKPYPFYFLVIVAKSRIDTKVTHDDGGGTFSDDGTFFKAFDPLTYYWYPIPRDLANIRIRSTANGEDVIPSVEELKIIMRFLSTNETAVNNIVSIYVTDYLPFDISQTGTNSFVVQGMEKVRVGYPTETDIPDDPFPALFGADAFLVSSSFSQQFTTEHEHLDIPVGNVFEEFNESQSKMRYFPYTVLELTDSRGNLLNYKPEGFLGRNGQLTLRVMGGLTYYNNVSYGLVGYNNNTTNAGILDNSIINTDPQDLPILVDQTASYMQGAKNSMQAKRNTWSSQQSYQQASAINRTITSAGKLLSAGVGIGAGAMGLGYGINAFSEGFGGMVQSGLDYDYAGTEYQNRIAEQNAMVEDLNNVPPSLQKQGNAPNFNIGYKMHGVRLRLKRIKPQYLERTRSYMHMFGTKTNLLKTPNLRTRTHFNYVQTTMLNVQSDFYNDDIQRFKQIFDSGITLWHTNNLYNYNVSNDRR